MGETQQGVIPTLSRAKISHDLSYPIGAERISIALASVPQLPELKLHFLWKHLVRRFHMPMEFLRVEYLNDIAPAAEYPIFDFWARPEQGHWEIIVQPVPRTLRHRVNQYIADSALRQIADWLVERDQLDQRGSDILAFFFDESSEEFATHQLTRLEPLRGRARMEGIRRPPGDGASVETAKRTR
jgi:hypothetical protein